MLVLLVPPPGSTRTSMNQMIRLCSRPRGILSEMEAVDRFARPVMMIKHYGLPDGSIYRPSLDTRTAACLWYKQAILHRDDY